MSRQSHKRNKRSSSESHSEDSDENSTSSHQRRNNKLFLQPSYHKSMVSNRTHHRYMKKAALGAANVRNALTQDLPGTQLFEYYFFTLL